MTLGLGEVNVRRMATDDEYRMDIAELRSTIQEDIRDGHWPLAVVATVGTTSTASVDPVPAIAALCQEYNLWLHVDAAYGGAMALLPEGRWVMEGIERADSVVVNPHKWFFVPLDFSALYTRHANTLGTVFAVTPEYLRGDAGEQERNVIDHGVQLGRRFRALKAWMVFRAFGREGLAARIRELRRLAQLVDSWIDADPDFETLAPTVMGVVCFRAHPQAFISAREATPARLNEFNRKLVEAVNATGQADLTRTELRGRVAIRLALGNFLTTEQHLLQIWQLIREKATRLRASAT
jgi:aromatic-L-amino-acid decarboxylase